MIPIPGAIKTKLLAWLPHSLAGYDYPVVETDEIDPKLIAPAITYFFSSVGTPSQYSNTILRTVRNANGVLDDYWGQYHFATMNVVLRATDKDELSRMWEDFIRRCLGTRRDLLLRIDHVRFVEILNSQQLEPQRLPGGKNLYWALVDLRFEYEVSDVSDAEVIRKVGLDLNVNNSHISHEWEIKDVELPQYIQAAIKGTRELSVSIVALIVQTP